MLSVKDSLPPLSNRGVTPILPSQLPNSSIDYYTCTVTSDQVGDHWLAIWNTHKDFCLKDGYQVKASNRYGFDIMYINGMTWGYSQVNGYMLQASSDNAHLTWQSVLPSARRISRLDLAYTFRLGGLSSFVADVYEQCARLHPTKTFSVVMNSRGGETMYVQSRTSDQFGRFYNKSSEDATVGSDVYRLEVEYKGKRSLVVAERLVRSMAIGNLDPAMVRDTVVSWFEKRGVKLGLDRRDDVVSAQVSATITSDDKKAKWLKTSVAPTIVDLTGRGKFQMVSQALALTASEYRQLALFASDFKGIEGLDKK